MQLSDYVRPISGLKYYVAMLDYEGKVGMGADVAPEYSRADIVATVRNHLASDRPIVHVKLIEGNDMQDVTAEIVADALALEAAE